MGWTCSTCEEDRANWISHETLAAKYDGVTVERVRAVLRLIGLGENGRHVADDMISPAAARLVERELRSRGYKLVG